MARFVFYGRSRPRAGRIRGRRGRGSGSRPKHWCGHDVIVAELFDVGESRTVA
jgi:hypothetical protein